MRIFTNEIYKVEILLVPVPSTIPFQNPMIIKQVLSILSPSYYFGKVPGIKPAITFQQTFRVLEYLFENKGIALLQIYLILQNSTIPYDLWLF